jgi:hypothetical protein
MASVRDKNGNVVRGLGSELTETQKEFIDKVKKYGFDEAAKIATEMKYTNYYRDRRTIGTAFYNELMKIVAAEGMQIEAAKGSNIRALINIRDKALRAGDDKAAMEAIKILNDMQGYKAPTKVQQTKIDVKATIDLTAPEQESEDIDYIDI